MGSLRATSGGSFTGTPAAASIFDGCTGCGRSVSRPAFVRGRCGLADWPTPERSALAAWVAVGAVCVAGRSGLPVSSVSGFSAGVACLGLVRARPQAWRFAGRRWQGMS